ncbi:MAG: hypothetical protein LC114_15485 [Bryobacterales bacterium]|nr:hypothetical protein [Bryobacterales bacterium]
MPSLPSDDPGVLSVKEVHAEFDKLLRDRHHMGLRNLIGDTFLEPRNPFQNKRRKAKRWVVAVVGLSLLGLLIFSSFHLR